MRPRLTISDVVDAGYCQRKAWLDAKFGRAPAPQQVQELADRGAQIHKRYERRGDARCFVASCIYGIDAPETNALRAFRDRVLAPRATGRCFVRAYYFLGPLLVKLIRAIPALRVPVKKALDLLVKNLPCL